MRHADLFRSVDCTALTWQRSQYPNGAPKGVTYATILPGGDGVPQVHLNRYDPDWVERPHRHPEDEVLILLEGTLTVGGERHVGPATIFVGRHTLYGPLQAGPEGALIYRIGFNEALMRRGGGGADRQADKESDDRGDADVG